MTTASTIPLLLLAAGAAHGAVGRSPATVHVRPGVIPVAASVSSASDLAAAFALVARYGLVTSTFRTVFHNRAVGGVPNSFHLRGQAVDVVRRAGVTHRQIDIALRLAGYHLLESLDEGTHSHFAFALAGVGGAPPVSFGGRTVVEGEPLPAAPPAPVHRLLADEHGTLIAGSGH